MQTYCDRFSSSVSQQDAKPYACFMLSIMVRFRFDLIEINFPGLNLNFLIKRRTAYDFVILTTKPANTIYLGYLYAYEFINERRIFL